MRALVTGGAGFIGSTLADRLLAEGHEVDVVDDLSAGSLANLASARASGGPFRFHQLDVRARELVELMALRRPEVVFHLAASTPSPPAAGRAHLDAEVNLLGTLRVLDGARSCGARKVVYAASGTTLYGELDAAELPVTEAREARPATVHGLSKKAAVDYLALYRAGYGVEFTALALATVYGPRQRPDGEEAVVAALVAAMLGGRAVPTDAESSRAHDLVFVDDAVDAFSRAALRGSGLVCNIGTGVPVAHDELIEVVSRSCGRTAGPGAPAAAAGPRRGGRRRGAADAPGAVALHPGRAALHLGWRPFTGLQAGVEAVVESVAARGRRPGRRPA